MEVRLPIQVKADVEVGPLKKIKIKYPQKRLTPLDNDAAEGGLVRKGETGLENSGEGCPEDKKVSRTVFRASAGVTSPHSGFADPQSFSKVGVLPFLKLYTQWRILAR